MEKNVIIYFLEGLIDPFEIIFVPIGVLSTVDCKLHMSARKRKCLGFFQRDVCPPAKAAQMLHFLERVLLHSIIDMTPMIVPNRLDSCLKRFSALGSNFASTINQWYLLPFQWTRTCLCCDIKGVPSGKTWEKWAFIYYMIFNEIIGSVALLWRNVKIM